MPERVEKKWQTETKSLHCIDELQYMQRFATPYVSQERDEESAWGRKGKTQAQTRRK